MSRDNKKLNLRNYYKFIKQYIDLYNWGWINDDKEKSFRYTTDYSKSALYKSYLKLKQYFRNPSKYRNTCVKDHLNARNNESHFLFYTNRKNTDIALLCGDIDAIEGHGYSDCLQALHWIKNTLHNDIYFEPSTRGNGIHFYILVDFSTFNLCDNLMRDYCNRIIFSYSSILSKYINNEYYCKFCGFKGTYFQRFEERERGTLGKLPLPLNDTDFNTLINTPVVGYTELNNNVNRVNELMQGLQHNIPITIMCRDFLSLCNKEGSKSLNAFERSRHICQQYFRDYYRNNNKLPSLDDYRRHYRNNPNSTGEETKRAYKRLKIEYEYVYKGFDNSLYPSAIYKVGDFLENIKNEITEEEIKQIIKNKTKYRYKITYSDIDVGLGYHYINLMTNKENKEFSDKELTVPKNDVCKWFKGLKEKGIITRSCCNGKADAIRKILIEIGYLECLNYHYDTEQHVSRRWAFTPKFPKYSEFIKYVGIETVNKVRKEGQEYAEYKKNKKSRKEVA